MNEFDHVHLFYSGSFNEESHFAHELLQHIKVENNSLNLTDLLYKNASVEIDQWMNDLSGSVSIAFMYNKNSDYVFPFFHTPSFKTAPRIQDTIFSENNTQIQDDETQYGDDDEIIIEDSMDNAEPPFAYFSNHFLRFITKLKENEKVTFINIDLLTCNLNLDIFKNYISEIESTYNIQIRYSIDKTGNPSDETINDVNWILESHGVNIRDLYFNETVVQWHGYLDNPTLWSDISGSSKGRSFSNGGGTTYELTNNFINNNLDAYLELGKDDIFDGKGFYIEVGGSSQRANGLFRIKSNDDYSGLSVNTHAPLIKNVEIRNASISSSNESLLLQQNSKFFRLENCRAISCTINSPYGAALCGWNAGNSNTGFVHINGCFTMDCTCVIAPTTYATYPNSENYEYELNGMDIDGYDFSGNLRVSGIIGGITRSNASGETYIVENCYNRNIKLYSKHSGGIVGGTSSNNCELIVRNCFSINGEIGYPFQYLPNNNGRAQGIGSICGHAFNGKVLNCFSNDVMNTGSQQLGFIVGTNSATDTEIINCYSTGDIRSRNSGGISGTSTSSDISNCFSTGNITGSGSGGLTGYGTRNTATITNCYSIGNISGSSSGGLCGSTTTNLTLRNSFTSGTIIGHKSGGLLGPRAACTFARGSLPTSYVEIYNSYAIGNMQMAGTNKVGGGLIATLSGNAYKDPFNHTIELYNCYYAGTKVTTSSKSGAIVGDDCFALKAYNCYSTDTSLPLIGTVTQGKFEDSNAVTSKADLYFYNCQSASGNFVYNTNADDISHIEVTLPTGTTYTGDDACEDHLYSTVILKSENKSHVQPYEPIYENDASYNSAQSPYDMHPWKSGTYNAWNDHPTLLWQHEKLNQPLSSQNQLCDVSNGEHILIDLGNVYNNDNFYNISLYNISDALGEGIKNINSIKLLNYKKQVQYIYEHGSSHDGLTDTNLNTVGAVRYYGPAKSSYAGRVPYASQSNASDEALIFYGTSSTSNYENESRVTLYQPNTSGTFQYILMRTRSGETPPNLRELQCWVSNVNVCISGNSLNPAVTPTGKFIDLTQNRTAYNQSHEVHLSESLNFGHPDLAIDNSFATHSYPVGHSDSLLLDLGTSYELKDLQCLIMYNRTDDPDRYASVDSIELLNFYYDNVAYYNHDASNNDKTGINPIYKHQYLYRGHAYNSIPTSMITNDTISRTHIRDHQILYLNGAEDGIISYTLTNPSLESEISVGKVIRTETSFDVSNNNISGTPSLKITTLRRKIKDCLIAEFLAKENDISGTEWLPNYTSDTAILTTGIDNNMSSSRLYGILNNGVVDEILQIDSEENGLIIPSSNLDENSTKFIHINLDSTSDKIANISWEFWFKINKMNISEKVTLITNMGDLSGTYRNASIHDSSNGYIGVEGSGTPSYIKKVDLYQLQHVIFTYDSTSGDNVYINGKKYYNINNSSTNEPTSGNNGITIFANSSGSNKIWDGFIYSFRCYNKILNDREVKYLYKEKYKCATVL